MTEYPQYPTDPNNPYGGPAHETGPATRGARPPSAALAVKLLWGAIALYVIGSLVGLSSGGAIADQLSQSGLSSEEADAATGVVLVVGGLFVLLVAGFFVLLTVFIGKGANWARIVSTVLAAIGVLLTLPSLFTMGSAGQSVPAALLSLVSMALVVAAIVLLYRPDSNAWFKAPRA